MLLVADLPNRHSAVRLLSVTSNPAIVFQGDALHYGVHRSDLGTRANRYVVDSRRAPTFEFARRELTGARVRSFQGLNAPRAYRLAQTAEISGEESIARRVEGSPSTSAAAHSVEMVSRTNCSTGESICRIAGDKAGCDGVIPIGGRLTPLMSAPTCASLKIITTGARSRKTELGRAHPLHTRRVRPHRIEQLKKRPPEYGAFAPRRFFSIGCYPSVGRAGIAYRPLTRAYLRLAQTLCAPVGS